MRREEGVGRERSASVVTIATVCTTGLNCKASSLDCLSCVCVQQSVAALTSRPSGAVSSACEKPAGATMRKAEFNALPVALLPVHA